jgi:hypothetical protein
MKSTRITSLKLGLAVLLAYALAFASEARAQSSRESARVRILLVLDTHGYKARELGFERDGENMKKVLKEAMRQQELEDRYTLDVLSGAEATPEYVLDYYRNLKVEPNETLLFYYSGHGATDRQGGHFLAMEKGRLYRSVLRQAMEQKRPRLLILLTDCCSNYTAAPGKGPRGREEVKAPAPVPVAKTGPAPASRPTGLKTNQGATVRCLLFRHEGVVDITASSNGHPAEGTKDRGGPFTFALSQLLNEEGRPAAEAGNFVYWSDFFLRVRSETQRIARKLGRSQVPEAFSLANSPAATSEVAIRSGGLVAAKE